MRLKEYRSKLRKLIETCNEFLEVTGYRADPVLTKLEVDKTDPSKLFEKENALDLMCKLDEIVDRGEYLQKKVAVKGWISSKRINDHREYFLNKVWLQAGTSFELLEWNAEAKEYRWRYTKIAQDSKGFYYLTHNGNRWFDGLCARMRDTTNLKTAVICEELGES